MRLWNRVSVGLLSGIVGVLSGCQSGNAGSGGDSVRRARAVIMETPGPGPILTRMILDDPRGVLEVEAWLKTYYQQPPPSNEMGAVLAQAGVVLSKEGDPTFSTGPARKWALYMTISTREREILIPRDHLEKFFEIFRRFGRKYDGGTSTGEYSTEFPKGSPPIEK